MFNLLSLYTEKYSASPNLLALKNVLSTNYGTMSTVRAGSHTACSILDTRVALDVIPLGK